MHIVWLNESAESIGGAERYIRETATGLRARGIRSTLLYQVASRADPDFVSAFEGAYPEVDLPRQIRELNPDILYVHRTPEGRAVEDIAALGRPAVRFFHDHKLFCLREHKYTTIGQHTCTQTVGLNCYPCLGFVQRDEASFPPVKLVTVSSLRRSQRANHGLAGYVVGSEYMGEHIARHGFDRSKIHVLPLFAQPVAKPSAPPPAPEPDLVLFVGQIIRGKGLDILLRAMALTRTKARLLIAGRGRQEDDMKDLAASLGLQGRVTFAGKLTAAEIPGLHARARCLVMPSRMPEPFGLAGLEALASGLPVIGSNVGAIPEWLEDGKSGILVPSGDAPAFAAAIDRLLENPDLASAMGRHGAATHRERFLPEHHVSRLESLLRKVAGKELQ